MSATIAQIGHNNPPSHLELLAEKYRHHAADVEGLAAVANNAPRAIKSDADLEAVSSLVKDARSLVKKIDASRVAEKEPHLTAGREVDTFFATMAERVIRISKVFQQIADDHARAKAEEARRKAAAEAEAARAEAARQADLARRAQEANRLETAEKYDAFSSASTAKAERAEEVLSASAADLTRQRLSSGTLASAKGEWTFEITDYEAIPLDKLRPYLKRDAIDAAIRQFVRMNKDKADLPGVRIFEDVKAVIR